MYDKTYCVNKGCPFKECSKHLHQLKNAKDKNRKISVAALDSVCRDYISFLVEEGFDNDNG